MNSFSHYRSYSSAQKLLTATAFVLIGPLLIGCGTPLLTEDEMYERAAALCDRGRGEEALQILDQIKDDGSQVGRSYYLKGVAYELNLEFEQSEKSYTKCLEKTPNDSDALNNRGSVRYRQGKFADAETDLNQAVQINPGDDLAWSNLSLVQRELGKLENSIASVKRALAIRPNPIHALQLSNLLLESDKLDEAEIYIQQSLKENPHTASAYLSRAILRGKQGRKDDAEADLELARKYDVALALQAAIGLVKQSLESNSSANAPSDK